MNKAAQIITILLILILLTDSEINGQFIEHFDGAPNSEWITFTGDGHAVSSFEWHDDYARFIVDATEDRQNVWWAIMRTPSVDNLDIEQLSEPGYELRLEARVRPSHAPRRLNMRLSTQRTVSNYAHLMEFDLPESDNWHTISMTTRQFDALPGDTISAHIALMDWGTSVYELDVDYVKIDVVDISESGPDKGEQVVYPPPVPLPEEFPISNPALEVGMIDTAWRDLNFSGWMAGNKPVLTIDNSKLILLRWDLDAYAGQTAESYGMLKLTPHSFFQNSGTDQLESDRVRLVEILGGDTDWLRESVTYQSFNNSKPLDSVLNSQMIIDIDLPKQKDKPLYIHIPRPVIQRLLNGRTKGIAIYPLGTLHASFYPGNNLNDPLRPKLYFNIGK
jgi:hypothetical protein